MRDELLRLRVYAEVISADLAALQTLKPQKRAGDEAAFQELAEFDEAFCRLRRAILVARLPLLEKQDPVLADYLRARLEPARDVIPRKQT